MQGINEFFPEIALIESLNNYQIILEVINGQKAYIISVYNLDGTKTEVQLTVNDLMYLTEYGSISSPAFHIFDYIMRYILQDLQNMLDELINNIFKSKYKESDIENTMLRFAQKINLKIPNYFKAYTHDVSFLANVLHLPGSKEYLLDPSILAKYVRCKIYKKI